MMNNKFFRASTSLIGTTIGAGIFGIPFVVQKAGFLVGIFYLLVLGVMVLFLNLIYGEVILRTPGDHQLVEYAQIYLGKWGKVLASVGLLVGLYGALLAYLIKTGEFLSLVFKLGSPDFFSLLFFVLASGAVFFGLRAVSFLEGVLVVFLLGLVVLIALLGTPVINFGYFQGINPAFLFLPYGVILFALSGYSVIPEMEEILRKTPGKLFGAITLGTLVSLITYILFATVVVGISGPRTSDDAIAGLAYFLPSWIVSLGAILGVLAMATSYLSLGFVLREVWFRDFEMGRVSAWFLACFPPLVLFLFGAKSFIRVLGVTGALTGGLSGVLIVLMFYQAKKRGKRKPAYFLPLPRGLLFVLGIIFLLGILSPWL